MKVERNRLGSFTNSECVGHELKKKLHRLIEYHLKEGNKQSRVSRKKMKTKRDSQKGDVTNCHCLALSS